MRRETETIPEFGIRLKEAIYSRGYTQASFARAMELDRKTIIAWCNDRRYPNASRLRELCEKLECKADYLLELGK